MSQINENVSARFLSTAPGRVNLLGEHVDYNDGIVLPAAIDRTVRVMASPREDGLVSLQTLEFNQTVVFNLNELEKRIDKAGNPLPSWALYPAGVAWALQKHGYQVKGTEVVYTSNVPIGAGLSSSAAVEVAFAALWRELGGWQMDNMKLAVLALEAENHYVGLNCGLMDQFASANGVEGHVLALDTRSLKWNSYPIPGGIMLVIANSGVRHSLTSSGYNDRRSACEQAVRLLQTHMPEIRALRDVSPEAFGRYSRTLPEEVRKRAKYVVEECARVNQALDCLQSADMEAFGRLMFATHAGLRDLYEVSCPELDALVEIASRQPGCLGARLTGAGFGGCTINLVREAYVDDFIANLQEGYRRTCGRRAEIYLCQASQGVQAGPVRK